MNGKDCTQKRYEGYFLEFGGSIGPVSVGVDFGSGVVEGGIGFGRGMPLKAALCNYESIDPIFLPTPTEVIHLF